MSELLIQSFETENELPIVTKTTKKQFFNNAEVLKFYRVKYKKGKEAKKNGDLTIAYIFFKDALHYARLVNWKEAILYTILEVADIDLASNKCNRAYKHYMTCLNIALMNDLDSLISIVYFKLSKYYLVKGNTVLSKEYNNRAINATS